MRLSQKDHSPHPWTEYREMFRTQGKRSAESTWGSCPQPVGLDCARAQALSYSEDPWRHLLRKLRLGFLCRLLTKYSQGSKRLVHIAKKERLLKAQQNCQACFQIQPKIKLDATPKRVCANSKQHVSDRNCDVSVEDWPSGRAEMYCSALGVLEWDFLVESLLTLTIWTHIGHALHVTNNTPLSGKVSKGQPNSYFSQVQLIADDNVQLFSRSWQLCNNK